MSFVRCVLNLARIPVLVLALACGGAAVRAEGSWPAKPITLIVPFSAAGPTDKLARIIAEGMSENLGQPVTVANMAGDGGTKGSARAAAAPADGYTLLFHHAAHAASASLYKGLPYDPIKNFEPIGLVSDGPYVLVGRTSLPIASSKQALQYIRTQGKKLTFGHAGPGSGSYLVNLQLRAALDGVPFREASYRGTGPAMNDLAAGNIDFLMDQSVNVAPHHAKGTVRPLAVAAAQRLATMKGVPTFHEAGLKGFEASQWHALYAPKGTPKAAILRLSAALEHALEAPETKKKFAESDTLAFPTSKRGPADARKKLETEVARWRKILKDAGVGIKRTE